MSYSRLIFILCSSVIIIAVWVTISICYYGKPVSDRVDIVLIAVLTGVISGFVSNYLFRNFEQQRRLVLIKNKLLMFEGNYDVFLWGKFLTPDASGYKINIKLDCENAIFKIRQTGREEVHELLGDIKINEATFTYGEGNYFHPKKEGSPIGRMQLYIIENEIINVDKYYLNDNGQLPGYEKWQWRKLSG